MELGLKFSPLSIEKSAPGALFYLVFRRREPQLSLRLANIGEKKFPVLIFDSSMGTEPGPMIWEYEPASVAGNAPTAMHIAARWIFQPDMSSINAFDPDDEAPGLSAFMGEGGVYFSLQHKVGMFKQYVFVRPNLTFSTDLPAVPLVKIERWSLRVRLINEEWTSVYNHP